MKWSEAGEALYLKIVEYVPSTHKELVATSLRRGAEARANRYGIKDVGEPEVVTGFFDVTPEPFHHQVKANLKGLGVDFTKYLSQEPSAGATADIDELINDFETMCLHMNVPFSKQKVESALRAYAVQFCRSPVAMRTTTKSPDHRDLAVRFLDLMKASEPDPLTTALSCGFIKEDEHPIFSYFKEAMEQCSAFAYGVDIEANIGFSKIWMAPTVGAGTLENVISLPHIPSAVKSLAPHFERYGLNSFGLLGFDFHKKSTNLYLMVKGADNTSHNYRTLLSDLGFQPDESEALQACSGAHVIYYSFSWTKAIVERVCLATVCTDSREVPTHFPPFIKQCLNDTVFMHGQRRCVYAITWGPSGYYIKLDNDYNGAMAIQLAEAGEVGVTPRGL